MGRAKTKNPLDRKPGESLWQHRTRIIAAEQDARDRAEPIVPAFAEKHGDYRKEFITHVETNTKALAVLNRGGSPVCRWMAQNRLSETQQVAIRYATHLWDLCGLSAPLTANYGERISGSGSSEARAAAEIEARRDLHRIQDYVPRSYWSVFEAVVRFGIPAGTAGATLDHATRNAKHSAYLTVCFVADVIAMKERLVLG